jgi:hypothetical protein
VEFNLKDHPHLDYGYAVTSHSSQGQTADRVLIHVDGEQVHPNLINSRMAYVSVSRGRYDAQIYTNNKTSLAQQLSRNVSHRSATDPCDPSEPVHKIDPLQSRVRLRAKQPLTGWDVEAGPLRSRRRQGSGALRGSLRSPLTAASLAGKAPAMRGLSFSRSLR